MFLLWILVLIGIPLVLGLRTRVTSARGRGRAPAGGTADAEPSGSARCAATTSKRPRGRQPDAAAPHSETKPPRGDSRWLWRRPRLHRCDLAAAAAGACVSGEDRAAAPDTAPAATPRAAAPSTGAAAGPCVRDRLGSLRRREALLRGRGHRARARRDLLPALLDRAGMARTADPRRHRRDRRDRAARRVRAEGGTEVRGDGQRPRRGRHRHSLRDVLRRACALGSDSRQRRRSVC